MGLAGLVATQAVNAAQDMSGEQTLVDKIVATFNLNKSDVQKVFDEERQTRQAGMQKKYEDLVAQTVKDGKLTQDLAINLLQSRKS